MGNLNCVDPLFHGWSYLEPEAILALGPGQVGMELLVYGGQGRHVAEYQLLLAWGEDIQVQRAWSQCPADLR